MIQHRSGGGYDHGFAPGMKEQILQGGDTFQGGAGGILAPEGEITLQKQPNFIFAQPGLQILGQVIGLLLSGHDAEQPAWAEPEKLVHKKAAGGSRQTAQHHVLSLVQAILDFIQQFLIQITESSLWYPSSAFSAAISDGQFIPGQV